MKRRNQRTNSGKSEGSLQFLVAGMRAEDLCDPQVPFTRPCEMMCCTQKSATLTARDTAQPLGHQPCTLCTTQKVHMGGPPTTSQKEEGRLDHPQMH